jgi:hypothetical protein
MLAVFKRALILCDEHFDFPPINHLGLLGHNRLLRRPFFNLLCFFFLLNVLLRYYVSGFVVLLDAHQDFA